MTAAVITGASAGLGAEFTRQLVREFPDIEEFWLIARRVGTIPLGLYAHPSYIAAHGTPATLAELAQHRLIGFDAETPFLRAAQKALPALQAHVRCAGGGAGAVPCRGTGQRRIGRLVR